MGGCQNYGPFLGTRNIRCRIIIGIPKGTIILTTIHILWVGPPTTNSGILGIYRDPNIITISSCGHYLWVGAQPRIYLTILKFRRYKVLKQLAY